MNNVFKNRIKIIEPKYNLQVFFQTLDYNLARKFTCMETEYYSKEILEKSQKNPVFIHFCGSNYFRPWYNPYHPYAKLFNKYAKMINCEDVIDYSVSLDIKFKIFYKFINNKIGLFLLYLIPSFLVRIIINRNALKEISEENKKAMKMYENNE